MSVRVGHDPSNLAVVFSCPPDTRTLSFASGNSNEPVIIGVGEDNHSNESVTNTSHNVCFEDCIQGTDAVPWHVVNVGDSVCVLPAALTSITDKTIVPMHWPCTKPGAQVLVSLIVECRRIRGILVFNYAAVRDTGRSNALVGGTTLYNAVRKATRRAITSKFGTLLILCCPNAVKITKNVGGGLHAEVTRHDVDAETTSALSLPVTTKSLIVFSNVVTKVINVADDVRRRRPTGWMDSPHRHPADGDIDIMQLIASTALHTLPAVDESYENAECYLFVAAIFSDNRVRSSPSQALVARRGILYHVSLSESQTDFSFSSSAYKRSVETYCAKPDTTLVDSGIPSCYILFHVFAHQKRQMSGTVPADVSNNVYWTALLGPIEASKLRDHSSRAPKAARTSSKDTTSIDVSETIDYLESDIPAPLTLGAYFQQCQSCASSAICMTRPMLEACGISRRGRLRAIPKGIKVVRVECPGGEDADASIPAWEGLQQSAEPALEPKKVSSSSLLAWCLGASSEPTLEEFDYNQRMLTSVGSVPLSAIAKRLRLMLDNVPMQYEVCDETLSPGNPRIFSIDVDLFEMLIQGTTSSGVILDGLLAAHAIFSPLDSEDCIASVALDKGYWSTAGLPRGVPLSDVEQRHRLDRLGFKFPTWLSQDPHEAEAIAFSMGILSGMIAAVGVNTPTSSHKAHVSRRAFLHTPFTRQPEPPTCGGRDRLAGFVLNIGDTSSSEALKIRVAVDECQRPMLERTLRLAAAAAFALHNPVARPPEYVRWMLSDNSDERAFYIPHGILVVVTALVACAAGYGQEGCRRCGGVILEMSFSSYGNKDTSSVAIAECQHDAFVKGGYPRADTAHHVGEILSDLLSRTVAGAIPIFTSYFTNTLPALAYIGLGCQYAVHDEEGNPIYMVPDASGLRTSLEEGGSCFACDMDGIVEPTCTADSHQPHIDRALECLPVVIDALKNAEHDDSKLLVTGMESAPTNHRRFLRTGNTDSIDLYFPLDCPAGAALRTTMFPPLNYIHRVMTYVPDLASQENRLCSSLRSSQKAGNLNGAMRSSPIDGNVLLLGILQRGTLDLATDVTALIKILDGSAWIQRTETTFHLQCDAETRSPSDWKSYMVPQHLHTVINLMYSDLFLRQKKYTHAHLADAALLGAATNTAIAMANLQVLRRGPSMTADRVDAISGLSDASYLCRHFFDGRLRGEALDAVTRRGGYTVRHIGGLARADIDNAYRAQVPYVPAAEKIVCSTGTVTARAKVAVMLARLPSGRLHAAFTKQLSTNPTLERSKFDRRLQDLLFHVVTSLPSTGPTRQWMSGLLHRPVVKQAVQVVGNEIIVDMLKAMGARYDIDLNVASVDALTSSAGHVASMHRGSAVGDCYTNSTTLPAKRLREEE